MKTALATVAALGLTIGAASAGCMGDTASHEKSSTVASLSLPQTTVDEATAEAPVDTGITTGAVKTESQE
jgi:hypothetical protein